MLGREDLVCRVEGVGALYLGFITTFARVFLAILLQATEIVLVELLRGNCKDQKIKKKN